MNRLIGLVALVVVIGFAATSMDVRAETLNIGFLGTGANADPGIIAYLEGQGHVVTSLSPQSGNRPATVALADASDVVLISESNSSGNLSDGVDFHLHDHPVRIVSWEPFMYDDAGWTGVTEHIDYGNTGRPEAPQAPEDLRGTQTDIYIVDAVHPLAAGLGPGAVTVYDPAQTANFGVPSSDADVVATADSLGNYPTIFSYDAGDQLVDGSFAPGARVGFFLGVPCADCGNSVEFSDFTADALTLLSAAVVPEPVLLAWDGTESDWGAIDDGHSHWSPDSTDLPSPTIGGVIDAGTCTVPDAYTAEARIVEVTGGTLLVNGTLSTETLESTVGSTVGGTGTIEADEVLLGGNVAPGSSLGTLTLSAAGSELLDTAVYECEIGADDGPVANDVIRVTVGDLALDGTLQLVATSKLRGPDGEGEWFGEQSRTIAVAEGDNSILYSFATSPTPLPEDFGAAEWGEGHIGRGVFLTRNNGGGENDVPGISYTVAGTDVHLFQALDGDTNGNAILDTADIFSILGAGSFLKPGEWDWTEGDFDGDKDVDTTDIFAILATGKWGNFDPYYPEPAKGEADATGDSETLVDLIVNAATGEVSVDTNGAEITGYVISSDSGALAGSAATQFALSAQTSDQIADMLPLGKAFAGVHDLGSVLDGDGSDLTLTYTLSGRAGVFKGNVKVVPEPGTLAMLLGTGLLGLLVAIRRRLNI